MAHASLLAIAALDAQPYTRGVGIYPGDPREDFGPVSRIDRTKYRNLALHRPAYHSTSYDYNLTAQLITDGIIETKLPRWIAVATSQQGYLKRNEREYVLDHNPFTSIELRGAAVWVQLELRGGDAPIEVDRVDVAASAQSDAWTCVLSGSDDGRVWRELGHGNQATSDAAAKGSIALGAPSAYRLYRFEFRSAVVRTWTIADIDLFRQNRRVEVAGPFDFTSAWLSATSGSEWVYVDLGARCTFDRVDLHWIRRAAEAILQTSDDAVTWRDVKTLAGAGLTDSVKLAQPAEGRYVRLLMTRPASPDGYILSELEVYGRGGPVADPKPGSALETGWRVERDSLVSANGEAISQPGFSDRGWLAATVPGTVLASYYNAGAIPDPNYGANQLMISDSFFYADFWYRNEFTAPPLPAGRRMWLHFDGINWKADVYLNGEFLGRIEGAFQRGRFDVTGRIRPGQKNALAVRIEKNATPGTVHEKTAESPGKNGGPLGADNPTFHASVGWDWIPTIRGRNTGIWNKVYLTTAGAVTLEDPAVTTKLALPDLSRAQVTIEATLHNYGQARITGSFTGRFGEDGFGHSVTLDAGETRTTTQLLDLRNPRLWWPNGYGNPNLYPVDLRFEIAGKASDSLSFQAGVRQFTYSEESGALRIWINGKRFVPRGGNWGFSEAMLRYRAREYDAAVRYHRDMNFTMIRNWVGQTGDDAFYEACDRYGIVVWQDFWLANPADGPEPDDPQMFLRNVKDTVLRIRNHPSIGLYCGRNEGLPPRVLDDGMRAILADLDPAAHYISSSADGPVSGRGPYRAMPGAWYFAERATPKLHSEMGMPNVPPLESLHAMMAAADSWPQALTWGLHDFTAAGAQDGASFRDRVEHSYGGADNLADWVALAQFVNYEGYRAMFEAQSRNRMGLLLWMTHPAWPSFVWQTYDYYLEPTAAYFGAKKGSEALHIQWNPVTETIEVVNYSGAAAAGLTAKAELRNMNGAVLWKKEMPLDSPEDSTTSCFPIEYPVGLTPVHFVRLELVRGGQVVSQNFYWRGLEQDNFRALRELPPVPVEANTQAQRSHDRWLLNTVLHNSAALPAIMVRLKAVGAASGGRILPAIYSDNYIALMPGERRTIQTELAERDTRGEKPKIIIEGFNVEAK
jgi:Exo-beta-D-glucosaminidase Ig-fold domain/Glycosyl hydrolases family 2/F5/8 type C domain